LGWQRISSSTTVSIKILRNYFVNDRTLKKKFFFSRFAHRSVNYIDFSPTERYLVTISPRPNNPEAFIVWDIITGQKKRSFPLDQHVSQGPSYFK
jgi:uncharacterized protein with WD repeat